MREFTEFEDRCSEMEEEDSKNELFPRCNAIGSNVEELKKTIRETLLKPIRFLRDANFKYVNIEEDNMADVVFISETQKNYAFLYAAFTSDTSLQLEELCEQGADVNFRYPGVNFNALHLSALHGSYECTLWLLEHGCSIMDYTSDGLSPLHYAALGNSLRICRFFYRQGCQVDSKALHIAVWTNAVEIFEFFFALRPQPISEYDESGFTVLHLAAYLNNITVIESVLYSRRVDVDIKTKFREYTALHLAAENGHLDCAKMLVSWRADVNALSAKGQTPLHLASRENFFDCVQYLLEKGAFVNVVDTEKRTPLHAAVSRTFKSPFQIHVVRSLIDRGADVNLADQFRYTALHVAASNELDECVEQLILSGANVAAKTEHNVTALNIMNRKTPNSCDKIRERLDKSLAYNEEELLKFNFRDINCNSSVGEVDYLYTLQKEGQAKVLEHPISEAFLHLKWQKIRILILLRLAVSVLSVLLLSLLISWAMCDPKGYRDLLWLVKNNFTNNESFYEKSLPPCRSTTNDTKYPQPFSIANCFGRESKSILVTTFLYRDSGNVSIWNITLSCNEENSSKQQDCRNEGNCSKFVDEFFLYHPYIPDFTFVFIVVVLLVNTVRIIFTLPAYKSFKHFFINYSNFIEILVTVCVPLNIYNMDTTIKHIDGIDEEAVRKSLAGLTMLFSWAYVMIMASQLPAVGAYVAMFKKVLKEFLIMNAAFLSLLVGFTFTFCTLCMDNFPNPIVGFAKIMAMMTGELNAKDLMEQKEKVSMESYMNAFILSIFTVIITVVLMNLLVGIAVHDVEGLRKKADVTKLTQQTKLIHFVEKCCFKGFFPSCVMDVLRKFLYVWPDSYTGIVMYVRPVSPNERRLPRDVMAAGLKIALKRKKMREACKKLSLEDRIRSMEGNILKLQRQSRTIQALLLDMASKLNASLSYVIESTVNESENV